MSTIRDTGSHKLVTLLLNWILIKHAMGEIKADQLAHSEIKLYPFKVD